MVMQVQVAYATSLLCSSSTRHSDNPRDRPFLRIFPLAARCPDQTGRRKFTLISIVVNDS